MARIGAGEMELEDAHSQRLPANVDAEDAVAMGAFIGQMLARHRIKLNRVIVDVPRDRAVINRLTVPPTPLNELAAAVRFQAMRELPFPIDEAAIDYVVTARNEDNHATEVLLAAVRREPLDRLRETCEAAGLTPARIGLRPYANTISVNHLPGDGRPARAVRRRRPHAHGNRRHLRRRPGVLPARRTSTSPSRAASRSATTAVSRQRPSWRRSSWPIPPRRPP